MVKKLEAPEQKKAPEPKKFIVKASGKKISVEQANEKKTVAVQKKEEVKVVEKKSAPVQKKDEAKIADNKPAQAEKKDEAKVIEK